MYQLYVSCAYLYIWAKITQNGDDEKQKVFDWTIDDKISKISCDVAKDDVKMEPWEM